MHYDAMLNTVNTVICNVHMRRTIKGNCLQCSSPILSLRAACNIPQHTWSDYVAIISHCVLLLSMKMFMLQNDWRIPKKLESNIIYTTAEQHMITLLLTFFHVFLRSLCRTHTYKLLLGCMLQLFKRSFTFVSDISTYEIIIICYLCTYSTISYDCLDS